LLSEQKQFFIRELFAVFILNFMKNWRELFWTWRYLFLIRSALKMNISDFVLLLKFYYFSSLLGKVLKQYQKIIDYISIPQWLDTIFLCTKSGKTFSIAFFSEQSNLSLECINRAKKWFFKRATRRKFIDGRK
jgi:hypothetical protein